MTTRILSVDLDGTLLDSQKGISPRTLDALRAFSDAGHVIALNSGRDVNNIKEVAETLGINFPRVYRIGYNGGEIVDSQSNETVFRSGMKKEQAITILETARNLGLHCHSYNDTHILAPTGAKSSKDFAYYRSIVHTPVIFTDDFAPHLTIDPPKCIAVNLEDQGKLRELQAKILSLLSDITVIFSEPIYLECYPAKSGKGPALAYLCEYLNIPASDAIAAGDQENDLSMLEVAGTGIAMRNGTARLKEIADIVTDRDNDHDGLAIALEKLGIH